MRWSSIVAPFVFGALGAVLLAACGAGGTPYSPQMGAGANTKAAMNLAPTPTPTPIQLTIGGIVGTPTFPEGDTSAGGSGQTIDGVICGPHLDSQFHHHVQVSLFYNRVQIALPQGTGMKNPGRNNFIYHADCYYDIHTHDQTGIVHIEPPNGTPFTLKQYFDVWGMPLSLNGFATYKGRVAVYINQTLQPGMDPTTVTLSPFEEIALIIGPAPSWIPVYKFPPGYK